MLALSGTAHATVVWTSTFEKGDLSEWSPGVNATKTLAGGTIRKNVVVQTAQVYAGQYACEITVHPDDLFGQYNQDRVDIQHQSTLTAEGQDTWISGHYMMPADAGVRNDFAWWESNVSFTNVMDFWVEPKTGGGTNIVFGVGFLGATVVWTADFAIGTWHQVALHVHWSTNATLGGVDVWFDGKQVVTAYKAKTKADANTLFYQNGLHRKNPANFVDTIYMDDFVEADSLADAQIAAPLASGMDGGGADGSAGTDGSTGTGDTGAGGATSGASDGATTGGDATTGGAGTSGASGSSGSGAGGTADGATGASGATSGAAGMSGFAAPAASGSGCGCAVPGTHTRATPLASLFALIGLALARRHPKTRRSRGSQE
jgi:MYXO-CTERM domain-containing protein